MEEYIAYRAKDGSYNVADFKGGNTGDIKSYEDLVKYVDEHRTIISFDLKNLGYYGSTYIRVWNMELNELGFYI